MSIIKYEIQQKNNSGTMDTMFPRTSADIANYDDTATNLGASNVQDAIVKLNKKIGSGGTSENSNQNYLLGAYDTENGNTITRQTGYLKLDGSESGWFVSSNRFTIMDFGKNINADTTQNTAISSIGTKFIWDGSDNGVFLDSNLIVRVGDSVSTVDDFKSYLSANPIYVQYKLATSYTDNKYNYSQQLANKNTLEFANEEANKNSQLLNTYETSDVGGSPRSSNITASGNTQSLTITQSNATFLGVRFRVKVEPNIKYTFYVKSSIAITETGGGVFFFTSGNTQISMNWFDDARNKTNNTITYTFTTPSNTDYIYITMSLRDKINSATFSNIMLNKGDHAMPYQPYNANKHIENYQADFLKEESNKSANLWQPISYNQAIKVSNGSYVIPANEVVGWYSNVYHIDLKEGVYSIQFISNNSTYGRFQVASGNLANNGILIGNQDTKLAFNKAYTFTLTEARTVYFHYFTDLNNNGSNPSFNCVVMLNKGNYAIPYQEYNGDIVHKKDLKNYVVSGDGVSYNTVCTSYVGGVCDGGLTRGWDYLYRAQHRNGSGDGGNYVMEMASSMTSDGDLFWRKKTGGDGWFGYRTILDSNNYKNVMGVYYLQKIGLFDTVPVDITNGTDQVLGQKLMVVSSYGCSPSIKRYRISDGQTWNVVHLNHGVNIIEIRYYAIFINGNQYSAPESGYKYRIETYDSNWVATIYRID